MRKLVVLLVLVGLLVGADVAAKSYAEGRLADRIESGARGEAQAEVDIASFPFLGRLLVSASAGDVEARISGFAAERLRFAAVEMQLLGVEVDRDMLFRKHISVTAIESGTAVLELGASELSAAFGVPVEVQAGSVQVTAGGQRVRARANVADRSLRLSIDPLPALAVALPRTALAPCDGDAEVVGERVRITCTFEEVPPVLLRAAQSAGG